MPYLRIYPPSIGVIEKAYQMLYLSMSNVNQDFMDSYQTVQREYALSMLKGTRRVREMSTWKTCLSII
jgi:hypothetical protein